MNYLRSCAELKGRGNAGRSWERGEEKGVKRGEGFSEKKERNKMRGGKKGWGDSWERRE